MGNSSWHGTRVAGILGAISNNDTGIAGMTWSGWILPVRVLGKCGGYDSDIIAGMAWAAGLAVEGVPNNPYPARIINMSLGAVGSCSSSYQQVVDELVGLGMLIVVSAGNEGGPVDAPANCAGVAAIAGLRQAGTKVGLQQSRARDCPERAGRQLRQPHRPAVPVLDRDHLQHRHDGAGGEYLHRRDELQHRHQLLGPDRLRDRRASCSP